jgi:hypothetical protein
LAVCVDDPIAVSRIEVVAIVVWWKLPTMVPLVKGDESTSGESIESVFVMLALVGVPE